MNKDKQKPSLALRLGYSGLLIFNSLAAAFGVLVVIFTRSELSKSGEQWGLMALPIWCFGGLVVMIPLLIATAVFIACAREKVGVALRWTLLFLILVGLIGDISPFIPEFRAVTVPLVKLFE